MKPEFIEFDSDTMLPFSMYGGGRQWDVEYCRRDAQLYIEESGGGHAYLEHHTNLWWASGLHPDIIDLKTGQRLLAPLENRIELPTQYLDEDTNSVADVDQWSYYGHVIPCEICQDRFPEDALCQHLPVNEY